MPEERMNEYLDLQDTAADWTPEGGAANDAAACPACGNALEIDADGWYICDHCEMAWQERPAGTFDEYLADILPANEA